jgi:hypothetical protein
MDTTASTDLSQTLKEATSNRVQNSKVEAHGQCPPLLFFQPETGEVIAVPEQESVKLIAEIGRWNSLVATLHDANAQVQFFEAQLAELYDQPRMRAPGEKEAVEKNWEIAVEWQEEVLDACRNQITSLDKIGSSGKRLVELIPIPTSSGNSQTKTENKPGDLKGGKYSKELKGSWAKGDKRVASKDWIRPPMGSLVYVASDKIESHWVKIKDPKKMKWTEVVAKDANGKRKIDNAKLKEYATESIKKVKLQSKDFIKLEVNVDDSLGAWATAWNHDTANQFSKKGKLAAGPITGDIELNAGAQFMRYMYGGSLNASFQPFKGDVSFRAEGQAEIALAEAKAGAAIYFPCKDGWMWTLPASLADKGAKQKDIDLGAVRLMASLELKGVVGASIAAEVSLGIEVKEGQLPLAKGKRTPKRGKRRAKNVQVFGPEDKLVVAGVDAGLNAFAGAKADAEVKGAIQWRNPDDQKKSFEAFAEVAPTLGGLAGVGAGGKLTIQYTSGIFKAHADASICIGLGAEGKIGFEANIKLLAKFIKWFFYQLYHANFQRLEYVEKTAFEAARDLAFIAINTGDAIEKQFGLFEDDLRDFVRAIDTALAKAEARQQLAARVLSDPEALRYAPPETKGMLIYQLSRHDGVDWAKSGFGLGDNFLGAQKEAIRRILGWSHTRSDCNNVIQHMSAKGTKGDFVDNYVHIRRFLSSEAPRDFNLPGIDSRHGKEFDNWYKRLTANLKLEPTRGHPVVRNDSPTYALQRDGLGDHPLFASTGSRGFYA